jgi:hypothetical protein
VHAGRWKRWNLALSLRALAKYYFLRIDWRLVRPLPYLWWRI